MKEKIIQIAPSVLSADFSRLGDEIRAVEKGGADLIHLDVMDGHFVPNITAGPILVEAARKATSLPLDAHLMIENPEKYIPDFITAGADLISIHREVYQSHRSLKRALQLIRQKGIKSSIAINPATSLSQIESVLEEVDMVLIMTVHPGFGGQKLIPSCLSKVERLRQKIERENLSIDIQVDGGIKADNVASLSQAGANIFVAGSAIFKSPDYKKTIQQLREQANSTASKARHFPGHQK